jgi:GNAT superfamily N-acetyltransferase
MNLDVRLARETDRDALRAMGEAMQAELRPDLPYDDERWNGNIDRCLVQQWPTILVVTGDEELIGFLMANCADWEGAAGFFIYQRLLYVRPDKRGTRAAAVLLSRFVRWAETFNPIEIDCAIGEGQRSALGARFLKSLGFEPAGQQIMRRPVGSKA